MGGWLNRRQAYPFVRWLLFGFSLLLTEALIIIGFSALYIWVERDLCPADFSASGHCYAPWFEWFERGFYGLALMLVYGSVLWLFIYFFKPLKKSLIRRLSLCLTVLLVIFVVISEWRFVGQTILVITAAQVLELYILSKLSVHTLD